MSLSLPSNEKNDDNEFFLSLPKEKSWLNRGHIYLYQRYWHDLSFILGVKAVQEHFKARATDVFLISTPKSGTIWLKAILFATMNRTRFKISDHPLLTTNPHILVPFLELDLFLKAPFVDVERMSSPRLFGTHMPLSLLPESVESSCSKIIYICRNPKDTLVSFWSFVNSFREKDLPPFPFEEAFELFSKGKSPYGPFWDHVNEYKQASLQNPDRVFFITYEEMKRDSVESTKRLAEFVGCPFSKEEENSGVIFDILRLCSFNNLRNLDVNNSGIFLQLEGFEGFNNKACFRRGEVGDWKNHLTTEMSAKLDKITNDKLPGIFT